MTVQRTIAVIYALIALAGIAVGIVKAGQPRDRYPVGGELLLTLLFGASVSGPVIWACWN